MLSQRCLHVDVGLRGAVKYRPAKGEPWGVQKGEQPSNELRSKALWEKLRQESSEIPPGAVELAAWLFDDKASQYLNDAARESNQEHPVRVELSIPAELADWPWEACLPRGLPASLGVHPSFTFVRTRPLDARESERTNRLDVALIGVELEKNSLYADLLSSEELEEIRQSIERAGAAGSVNVLLDPQGSWETIAKQFTTHGPPDVFHFAGHGAEDGKGLVFRGLGGQPQIIGVSQLSTVLLSSKRLQLAFLNACYSAKETTDMHHPLGGLAHTLHEQGVPAVVGIQSPIKSSAAQRLARAFYANVAKGVAVDVAIQRARRDLFLGNQHAAWPFAVLSVNGSPQPLCTTDLSTNARGESANIDALGFGPQQVRLRALVESRQPTLVFIHGATRMGHAEVQGRLQRDLEKSGAALWRPVAALKLSAGEPILQRQQLAAAIARALSLGQNGEIKKLETSIAGAIADRTRDRVLVIDISQPMILSGKNEIEALDELVALWGSLTAAARARSSHLPVFLLVPIAYAPKRFLVGWTTNARATREKLESIAARQNIEGVIDVLPELERITEFELVRFFRYSCGKADAEARRLAQAALREPDNEAILGRVRGWMSEWGRL